MSLYLEFTKHPSKSYSEAVPSVNLTPNRNGYLFDHVEINIDGLRLTWFGGAETWIDYRNLDDLEEQGGRRARFKLDESLKDEILKTRRGMGTINKLRWKSYMDFTKNEFCAEAWLKTGFTCANMVGYLLGYEDYYKLVPDDIWYRSLGYPINYLS